MPPDTVTVAVPVLPPLQDTFEPLPVATKTVVGPPTVCEVVATQPVAKLSVASLTVTV